MQNTSDPQSVMVCLMQTGLEAADWKQRQATALFLSLPGTPLDGAGDMHRDLVRSLCTLLTDQVEQVAQSGRQALDRVHSTIGDADFAACIRALPPNLRAAFEGDRRAAAPPARTAAPTPPRSSTASSPRA